MGYRSKNMNYIFHVEYFDGLELVSADISSDNAEMQKQQVAQKNALLCDFAFDNAGLFFSLKEMQGYQDFALYTQYPGLLIGTGNPHAISEAGAVKLGFSFDYVSGVPYIPGSSLKGMLRSMFPGDKKKNSGEYAEMIREMLGKDASFDVDSLKTDIFEGNKDVFLGAFAFPDAGNNQFLEMEYITSHKEKFKNPIPISLIKVRPDIAFRFSFLLTDYVNAEGVQVTASEKLELFRQLILLAGIGAKTNVGYGKFAEKRIGGNQRTVVRTEVSGVPEKVKNDKMQKTGGAPKCKTPGCSNHVTKNPKTDRWNSLCMECHRKSRR